MTAFRARYDNLQVQANQSSPVFGSISFLPVNADSSLTQGVEIEARIRPVKGFSVNAAVAYKKSELDATGLNCPIQARATASLVPIGGVRPVNRCYRYQFVDSSGNLAPSGPVQDVRGGDLPGAPNWRINLSPRYEKNLGTLLGFAQVDVSYQSDEQFAIEQDPNQIQDGYTIVDASIGLRRPDSRYTLTLFVKNLFDTNYYSNLQVLNLLPSNLDQVDRFALRVKNADRYVGAAFGFRF